MSEPFAITTPTKMLEFDDKGGHGQAAFAVRNTSGSVIPHGRVRLVPEDPIITEWIALDGEPERRFAADEIQTFNVQVTAPPTPPAGLYNFRLDAYDMADPNGTLSPGPRITIAVAQKKQPKQIPWLLIAGGVVALLVVIGIVAFLLWPKGSDAAKFDGDWVLNFGTMSLNHNGNTVQGTFVDQFDNTTGSVQGTVAGNTFTGNWSGNGAGQLIITVNEASGTVDGERNDRDRWCGARAGRAFPSGCSFAGQWRTSIDGAQFDMSLSRVMSDVVGSYMLVTTPTIGGRLTGTLQYNGATTLLTGSYGIVPQRTPVTRPVTGTMQFFLNDANALQFNGSWRESPARVGAWCGWRTDTATPVPSPVPCRRP